MTHFRTSLLLPVFTAFILCFGCVEDDGDTFTTYIIKKGNHNAENTGFTLFDKDQLSFLAKFDASAIYNTQDPNNQADNNKLLGFSDCSTFHQTNSARFGWWWNGTQVGITAYCYFDGERTITPLGTVDIDEVAFYSIEKTSSGYAFTLKNQDPVMVGDRNQSCSSFGSYMLWPYFGGDEQAPQDISIQINMEN